MRISFLGLDLRLNKAVGERDKFNLSDVNILNAQLVEKIKGLGSSALPERISSVTVSDLGDTEKVKEALREHGIAVIPNFVPHDALACYETQLNDMKGQLGAFVRCGERVVEQDDVLFQRGSVKVSGYDNLSTYEKAIVQIREGQDEGMVDVFNVDKWFPELGDFLRPYFETLSQKGLVTRNGNPLQPKNLNIYFNYAIKETRGFHVDSYKNEVKAFIYLSDVRDLGDGPYTYVKGSHAAGIFRRMNMALSSDLPNATEFPIVPFDEIIPVVATKGALVISDQSGAHRGFPQLENRERVIAVMKYR